MISHEIRLGFLTDLNNSMSIRIPHANELLTDAQVINAMQGIISTAAVQSTRGTPRFRSTAELITTNTSEFNII